MLIVVLVVVVIIVPIVASSSLFRCMLAQSSGLSSPPAAVRPCRYAAMHRQSMIAAIWTCLRPSLGPPAGACSHTCCAAAATPRRSLPPSCTPPDVPAASHNAVKLHIAP